MTDREPRPGPDPAPAPDPDPAPGTDPETDEQAFVELADDAVQQAAVLARVERRELRDRAAELATWPGTLRDLVERAEAVAITVRGGRSLRGHPVGIGGDHLVLATADGGTVHVRVAAIRSVRTDPGRPAPTASGDRPTPGTVTVEDVLDRLLDWGGTAVLHLRDVVDPVRGRVRGIGEDVVTVRLDGPDAGVIYVPSASIDAVRTPGTTSPSQISSSGPPSA